jgi:hydroxyacylglutathione hydrolase
MKVEIIPCLKDNYSYLIIDEKKNICCVVDPSESDPIIEYLEKNKIDLKFILNTHHHFDHVGGNKKLKEKYNASVIGYKGDKDRIPGIDILVDDQEIWKHENFETKIIHIPGHTLGHICFYFYNDKLIFTGDTLFSLGCGRIFEGTYSQMFQSINKIKKLPNDTKIYCGHEYTKNNLIFCLRYENNNAALKEKLSWVNKRLSNGLPTVPTTLKEELETNIFLRCNNIGLKDSLQMTGASDEDIFEKLRDLKDNF